MSAETRVVAAAREILAASRAWQRAGMDAEASDAAIDRWNGAEVELRDALSDLDNTQDQHFGDASVKENET